MTAIGVDTHKATLAACAIDDLGRAIDEATFNNDPAGHVAFIAWARSIAPEATIGHREAGSAPAGGSGADGSERSGHRERRSGDWRRRPSVRRR